MQAPNLWIFVKEVLEVFRKVNDAFLHLGDVAPSIELNFTQELGIVCHLNIEGLVPFFNSFYIQYGGVFNSFSIQNGGAFAICGSSVATVT